MVNLDYLHGGLPVIVPRLQRICNATWLHQRAFHGFTIFLIMYLPVLIILGTLSQTSPPLRRNQSLGIHKR
jgi:hypothetical protein